MREATDAIAATESSVTVSIYTGTIVEVASPEEIGPAVLNVVKASNDVSKVYGFRKLTPTTLAHEYTLNRSDERDKNSLAVLNLREMLELDALGSGMSELKHCLGLQIEPEIYAPATATHVSYLLAPESQCSIMCYIESTENQPPLFEQSAALIVRINLHPDSEPFRPKKGPGSGKPYSITIKEEGKDDVVLHAATLADGVGLLKKEGVSRGAIDNRLSGKVTSDLVKNGKTYKFAYTKIAPLPKKEELEQDMYLVLPFNNEKLLEALKETFKVSCAARTAFMDLKALRADPLRYFADMGAKGHLSDDEKKIVARGFVTKKELQGAIWPYLTGYKIRMDAQRDRVLASTDFIKEHVASTELAEDAATLKDRVTAELAWLFDAADAFDDAYAAAQAAEAAMAAQRKAAKASGKAPKKSSRKRMTTVPKKTSINSDDASDEEMAAIGEEPAANAKDCVSDDDVASYKGDSSSEDEFVEQPRAPTRQSKRRKVDAPPATGAYQIGDRVEAHWYGGEAWFPGTIDECNTDGTYAVLFDDDGYDDPVLPHHVRRAP